MIAFISFSTLFEELYLVTRLSTILREEGFGVDYEPVRKYLGKSVLGRVGSSHVFVGFISKKGQGNGFALSDWHYAKQRNIPAILIVEQGVELADYIQQDSNTIIFDPQKPEKAFNLIQKRIKQAPEIVMEKDKKSNAIAWILGGGAVGNLINSFAR